MRVSYRIEVANTNGQIVRVEDFTRITRVTSFHRKDTDLANKLCVELTNALAKRGTPCLTTK